MRPDVRLSRQLAVVLVAAALLGGCVGAAAALDSSAKRPTFTVVAKNLDNPRKLFAAPGGGLYVVEAGHGGRARCLGSGASRVCVGLSGSVAELVHGTARPVVTGLFSVARPDGRSGQGPADVLVRRRSFLVLLQDTTIDSHGANDLGPDGTSAGELVSTPAGRAKPAVIANLAEFEAENNPDHGAGPGARYGDPAIDSDPYAFTPYRGGLAVVDAAGNDLLRVSPKGSVSVLAVFPTEKEKLTKAVAAQIGAPASATSITVQSVPTCVAVGPDGALYVGELTGAPFAPGSARIWRVVPGRPPTLYASGFTTISDLAFDGKNLLVLELAEKGLLDRTSPGALIRLSSDGKRKLVASTGLVYPTGLVLAHGSIYISNDGAYPARGPGPHGEVVRIPASLGA